MKVESVVGVDVVSDPGQENQVEESLCHLLLEIRCEYSGCLVHGRRRPLFRLGEIEKLFPIPELGKHFEGLGHLARSVSGQEDAHLCVHLAHVWVDVLYQLSAITELGLYLRFLLRHFLVDDVTKSAGSCLAVGLHKHSDRQLILLIDSNLALIILGHLQIIVFLFNTFSIRVSTTQADSVRSDLATSKFFFHFGGLQSSLFDDVLRESAFDMVLIFIHPGPVLVSTSGSCHLASHYLVSKRTHCGDSVLLGHLQFLGFPHGGAVPLFSGLYLSIASLKKCYQAVKAW